MSSARVVVWNMIVIVSHTVGQLQLDHSTRSLSLRRGQYSLVLSIGILRLPASPRTASRQLAPFGLHACCHQVHLWPAI